MPSKNSTFSLVSHSSASRTKQFKKRINIYSSVLLGGSTVTTKTGDLLYLKNSKVIGHNTDIEGFETAIKNIKFDFKNKKVFILGAGGVVPSIIYALNNMKASSITIANRTQSKAENLKNLFKNLKIINWGKLPDFDMIINATSIGLSNKDKINFDFSKLNKNKFFYDVIYNPKETNFLKTAKNLGNDTENGKKMFIYQAAEAFNIWHGIKPDINQEVDELLD